jgi:hypothetical protein
VVQQDGSVGSGKGPLKHVWNRGALR